jgi:hypothetical protein
MMIMPNFAANQARRNARLHNTLEHPPEDSTLAEPLVASAREHRVIRNLVGWPLAVGETKKERSGLQSACDELIDKSAIITGE